MCPLSFKGFLIAAKVSSPTDEAELDREKDTLRIPNRTSNKDLMSAAIIRGSQKPSYYENLSKSLPFTEIKEMTSLAIQHQNPKAIMALLKTNIFAASSALFTNEGTSFFSEMESQSKGTVLLNIFFMVRTIAPKKYKTLLRQLARNVILKTTLHVAGRGIEKGMERVRVPYYPGMVEFDLNQTFTNVLEKGEYRYITYQDIVGVERNQLKKTIVLILDTSGSMYGRSLVNAALTTSILTYTMRKHRFAIILFNSNSMVLKAINEEISKTPISKLIDEILDSEAVGFTNIENALKRGLNELHKVKGKKKFGILITDGNYNRGKNPSLIAKNYPKLHVIAMPPPKKLHYEGLKICRNIAEAGHGKFYPVSDYKDIPQTLLHILRSN
ncbi:MAG: VWA domain-containing protein [Candidatus Lokiarchaeota archaeon]|nr:VWA domain-containing protein [Candidatus Lokiarchaeota archaeon]